MTDPKPKGNPASSLPMRGLSKRATDLLQPRKHGFCTPIEPPGSGLARNAKTKTRI